MKMEVKIKSLKVESRPKERFSAHSDVLLFPLDTIYDAKMLRLGPPIRKWAAWTSKSKVDVEMVDIAVSDFQIRLSTFKCTKSLTFKLKVKVRQP